MRTFLFVCNDHVGPAMAGPGIRAWEMARAVRNRGHDAVVLARRTEQGLPEGSLTFAGRATLKSLVFWIGKADTVIMPGSPLALLFSLLLGKKIFFDQYDPVIFEFLASRPGTVVGKLRKSLMLALWRIRQRLIVRFGDGFLVANEKQKDFLIGQLALAGRSKKLDCVTVLPFGLPDEEPIRRRAVLRGTRVRDSDFLLVWGGGIWEWFDPFTLLRALAVIRQRRSDIKVFFPGILPPNPDVRRMTVVDRFLAEAKRLDLLDIAVFIHDGWVPYADRADYLLEADAGISLHYDSLETRFAFRTRMLDYLWAGLPAIASKGDSWADLIESRKLGLTVPCNDDAALAAAIESLADDDDLRRRCRERVRDVASAYRWGRLAESLIAALTEQP